MVQLIQETCEIDPVNVNEMQKCLKCILDSNSFRRDEMRTFFEKYDFLKDFDWVICTLFTKSFEDHKNVKYHYSSKIRASTVIFLFPTLEQQNEKNLGPVYH